jgi:hypothetical protein
LGNAAGHAEEPQSRKPVTARPQTALAIGLMSGTSDRQLLAHPLAWHPA